MSFENLQTISNISILLGGILLALGGYGHYHYGKKIELDKETKALKETRQNFISDISKLIKPIESQIKEIEKFSDSANFDERSNGLTIIHNLKESKNLLSKYDYNLLLESFGNKKEKPLYNLWQKIAIIDTIIQSIEADLPKFASISNEHKKIIRDNLHRIFEIRDNLYTQYTKGKIDLNKNPFVREFIEVCEGHMKVNKEYKFLFGKVSLIDPLFELRSKYLGKDENLNQITPFIMTCSDSYKRMEEAKSDFLLALDRNKHQLDKLLADIKSDLTKLEK